MMLVKAIQQKTNTWSGGTTTELFIYPPDSEYNKHNFEFRVSTATVNVEESTFTQLPGYKRILMILKGELFIEHKNHYSNYLKQYDCHEFLGAWETQAKGKVIDFNLMMNEKTNGAISIITYNKQTKNLIAFNSNDFIAFYIVEGSSTINSKHLSTNDFIIFEKEKSDELILIAPLEDCKIVKIVVAV